VIRNVVLAVDGGNSKTDLALVGDDGRVLGLARGPLSSPHHIGLDGSIAVLERLLERALHAARLWPVELPVAVGELLMAGVDFPSEEQALDEALAGRGWARRTVVGNDTFAVLRAGTDRGWGIGIVCGTGINCVGVAPDGRTARFPALGAITGDWGGGYDLGLGALSAAARSEDGRGPATSLERSVPAFFGLETPQGVAEAIHTGRLAMSRVSELAPLVLAEAGADGVAAGLVARLADEIVALARASLERLSLNGEAVDVVLGGGVVQAGNGRLFDAIAAGLREVAPAASVHATDSPPIVGAALLGLDELGAPPEALERLRRELGGAVRDLDGNGRFGNG
jgi:N-acetylglucosamine kinase-like BadF-type ATPase